MTRQDVVRQVAAHPKLLGLLFGASALLADAGAVLANGGCSCGGP